MKQIMFIKIGTGFYAVEVGQVKRFLYNAEVVDFGDKEVNSGIIGMIHFDDELIPVLDLYRLFGQKQVSSDNKTVFVIMMLGDRSFAFPISAVIKSIEVPDECFHKISDFNRQANAGLFKEVIIWEETLYLKINAEAILKKITTNAEMLL